VEFFVPHASTPAEADEVWEATRKVAAETMEREGGTRRIFRLHYRHNGDELVAEVGKTRSVSRVVDFDWTLIARRPHHDPHSDQK